MLNLCYFIIFCIIFRYTIPGFSLHRKSNYNSYRIRKTRTRSNNLNEGGVMLSSDVGIAAENMISVASQVKKNVFSCNICRKIFKNKSCLTVHKRTHTGEKPYLCTICQKTFRQKVHLVIHFGMHQKPFVCSICGSNFGSKQTLKRHHLQKHSI